MFMKHIYIKAFEVAFGYMHMHVQALKAVASFVSLHIHGQALKGVVTFDI